MSARDKAYVIPCLFTLGNALCGFGAVAKLATIEFDSSGAMTNPGNLQAAVWLILLGMIFDMFDGRVARLVHWTSDFGAQLDSMADAVTFGVAPGLVIAVMNSPFATGHLWSKLAWVMAAIFVCGAILRLARFNVENSHDEAAHRWFKGLPSPAAAGCVATFVILQAAILRLEVLPAATRDVIARDITYVLPFAGAALGWLMVSNVRYVHFANIYLKGRRPADYAKIAVPLGILILLIPGIALFSCFALYAASGPLQRVRSLVLATPEVQEVPTKA